MNYLTICLAALFTTATQLHALPPFPLHQAVTDRKPELVKMLIANGADPQKRDGHYVTALYNTPIPSHPLRVAAKEGKKSLIKKMLDYGAKITTDWWNEIKIDYFDSDDESEIEGLKEATMPSIAAAFNHSALAQFLIEQGNNQATRSWTARMLAFGGLHGNDTNILTLALAHYHDAKYNLTQNLAEVAISKNRLDIMQLLLKCDSEIELSPLLNIAIQHNNLGAAQFLLSQGADIEYCSLTGYESDAGIIKNDLLNQAIQYANTDMIQLLFAHGASLTFTRLYHAISYHKKKATHFLLTTGAALYLQQPQAITLLRAAIKVGNSTLISLLLSYGIEVNTHWESSDHLNGTTPLHWAAESGRDDLILLLAAAGANCNATDNHDRPPLVYATTTKAQTALIRVGANVNPSSISLLHVAIYRKNPTAVEFLLQAGADIERLAYSHIKYCPARLMTPINYAIDSSSWDSCKSITQILLRHGASLPNAEQLCGQIPQQAKRLADNINLAQHWTWEVEQALLHKDQGSAQELPKELATLIRTFATNAKPKQIKTVV